MKFDLPLYIIVAIVFVSGGFWLGSRKMDQNSRVSLPHNQTSTALSQSSVIRPAENAQNNALSNKPPTLSFDEVLKQVDSIFSGTEPEEHSKRNALLAELFKQVSLSDMPSLYATLKTRLNSDDFEILTARLLGRWGAENKQQALDFVDTLNKGDLKNKAYLSVMSDRLIKSPKEVLNWALELNDKEQSKNLFPSIIYAMASKNFQETMDLVNTNPELQKQENIWGTLVCVAQTSEFPHIAQLIQEHLGNNSRTLYTLVHFWSKKNPNEAWSWSESLPKSNFNKNLKNSICYAWSINDFDGFLKHIKSLPEESRDQSLYYSTMIIWLKKDLSGAQAWVESLPEGNEKKYAITGMIHQLSQADPKKAAELISKLQNQSLKESLISQLAYTWKSNNPDEFKSWVEQLPDGEYKKQVLRRSFQENASNPEQSAEWLLRVGGEKNFTNSSYEIASALIKKDPTLAIQWAERLKDPENKSGYLGSVFYYLAQANPQDAAQRASSLSNPKDQATAMSRIASQWISIDPPAATAWVAQLPEGDSKNQAWSNLVDTWLYKDPTSASKWLETQPASPAKDSGIQSLVNQFQNSDPEAAAKWSEVISDPKAKQDQMYRSASQWIKKDKAAATAWIQQSPLSDDQKKKLLGN